MSRLPAALFTLKGAYSALAWGSKYQGHSTTYTVCTYITLMVIKDKPGKPAAKVVKELRCTLYHWEWRVYCYLPGISVGYMFSAHACFPCCFCGGFTRMSYFINTAHHSQGTYLKVSPPVPLVWPQTTSSSQEQRPSPLVGLHYVHFELHAYPPALH